MAISSVLLWVSLYADGSQNIEEHEDESKSPSLDAKDFRTDGEVVNHSSQDHIDVCIDPQRCKLYMISA